MAALAGLVVRGVHWLVLSPREDAARPRRTLQQLLNDPPLLTFGPIPSQIGSRAGGDGSMVGLRRTLSLSEGHILHGCGGQQGRARAGSEG